MRGDEIGRIDGGMEIDVVLCLTIQNTNDEILRPK